MVKCFVAYADNLKKSAGTALTKSRSDGGSKAIFKLIEDIKKEIPGIY